MGDFEGAEAEYLMALNLDQDMVNQINQSKKFFNFFSKIF